MSYAGAAEEMERALQSKAHQVLTDKLRSFYQERARAWGNVRMLLKGKKR